MKKIIKLVFDSDLLHPDQKEKKNIEKIVDSIKIPFEEIETEVWIDKSHNDKITIDRKDFVDELSRALYYNVITKKASTIFLQWFDEYKNEDDGLKKTKMNGKEWLMEMIECFVSDLNNFRGNTDEPKLIPTTKSMIAMLEEYIALIKNNGILIIEKRAIELND